MGFFEKVKNMFTEEVEEEDVKVEKIKKEVTRVPIESPAAKKEEEEVQEFKFELENENVNKPVFFDDNDFKDLNLNVKEEKIIPVVKEPVKEKEYYSGNSLVDKKEKEKKIFKPTPIISPVYGILDKNYHKEDIISREESLIPSNSNKVVDEPTIDSIRNKAYGTLEDELENTLFGSNSILFKKDDKEEEVEENIDYKDDLLSDLTDDMSKELDEILIKKERYVDSDDNDILRGRREKVKDEDPEDLLDFIDSTLYKEGDEE